MAWDSYSNTNLIHPDAVPADAEWLSRKETPLGGVVEGATLMCTGIVKMQMKLVAGGRTHTIEMKVAPPPKMATGLIGFPEMDTMRAKPDTNANRVILGASNELVFTDYIRAIDMRQRLRPIHVLSIADGIGAPMISLLEAGFNIGSYRAIEADHDARKVAKSKFGETIKHVTFGNALSQDFSPDVTFMATSSRAWDPTQRHPVPLGFDADTEQGESGVFARAASLMLAVRIRNPTSAYFCITSEVHAARAQDAVTQTRLLQSRFQSVSATHLQSAMNQHRRIATNMLDYSHLKNKAHDNPLLCLDRGWYPSELPFPPVTHRQSNLRLFKQGDRKTVRGPTADEQDRMLGYAAGATAADQADGNQTLRRKLAARTTCHEYLWEAIIAWNIPSPAKIEPDATFVICDCVSIYGTNSETAEAWLSQLSQEALDQYCEDSIQRYGPLAECELLVDPNLPPFQTKRKITLQQPMQIAMDAKVDHMIAQGSVQEISYRPDIWIHDLLGLKKEPERIDAATGQLAIRPVAVLCAINGAHEYQPYLAEECPSVSESRETITSKSKYFIASDASDGYHVIVVKESSRKYLCVGYWSAIARRYRILMYLKLPQGLKTSGVLYPAYVHDGYNRCYGYHWRDWWKDHVDDTLTHAECMERCWARFRLLVAAQRAMHIEQSPKLPPTCSETQHWVGLTWTQGMLRASDNVRTAMRMACDMRPTSARQVRKVIGIVKQSTLALNYSVHEITKLGDIYTAWQDSIDGTKCRWTDECIRGQQDILDHEGDVDWLYWDADAVLTDERSLLILTDRSVKQIGMSLFTVKIRDADQIKIGDINDPQIAGILDIAVRKLTPAEQRYHTAEGELLGGVNAVKKYGAFITSCTANLDPDGRKAIAIATDSTPAKGSWKAFSMPHVAHLDYLTAKSQRLFGWVDDIAYTRMWPLALLHFAGQDIILVDYISRTAECFLAEARLRQGNTKHVQGGPTDHEPGEPNPEPEPVPDTVNHIAAHSYHPVGDTTAQTTFNIAMPLMAASVWQQLHDLQKHDTSSFNAVTVADIFSLLSGETVPKSQADKIRPWRDAGRFALVKHPPMPAPVLFTQETMQRVTGEQDSTRNMVMVLPEGLDVRFTKGEDLYKLTADLPSYLVQDLRKDLMLLVHEFADHMIPADMHRRIRALAMWPTLKTDCIAHWRACRRCIALMDAYRAAGTSVVEMHRLKQLKIDVWHNPPELKRRTGCMGVLVMIDAAGSMTRLASVISETAEELAWIIVRYWVCLFGVMDTISSDNAQCFAGKVFEAVCDLFGIKRDFGAVGDSRHMGQVETRHNQLKATVMNGMVKGDIRTKQDLELYLGFCEMKVNHLQLDENLTSVFELYFTQPPGTIMSLIQQGDTTTAKAAIKQVKRTDLLKKLDMHVSDFMQAKNEQAIKTRMMHKEQRSRQSVLHRDHENESKAVTRFDLRPGDSASWSTQPVTIISTEGDHGGSPITAKVQLADGNTKKVKFEDLRPLGTDRKAHTIPRATTLNMGAFVFYEEDGMTFTGVVVGIQAESCTVHDWAPAESNTKKYMPLWKLKDGAAPQRGPMKRPPKAQSHRTNVTMTSLLFVGELTDTNYLTEETVDAAAARGISLQLD